MTATEPETFSWLRLLIACGIVGGLLAGLGFALKYLNKRGVAWTAHGIAPAKSANARRLAIVESLPLDIKRRMVIVRCDDREHLLLLGLSQDIVVASDLDSQAAKLSPRPSQSP